MYETEEDFYRERPQFGGTVFCKDGKFVPSINFRVISPLDLDCGILECRIVHERRGVELYKEAGCECPIFRGPRRGWFVLPEWIGPDCVQKAECFMHKAALECLKEKLIESWVVSPICASVIEADIDRRIRLMVGYNCGTHGIAPPAGLMPKK